jgi:hypothetical protein
MLTTEMGTCSTCWTKEKEAHNGLFTKRGFVWPSTMFEGQIMREWTARGTLSGTAFCGILPDVMQRAEKSLAQ